MKNWKTLIFTLIIAFSLCNCKDNNRPSMLSLKETKLNQLIQSKDSGYIVKKKGLDFLLSSSLTDTLNSNWNQTKDNDTIGKYYKDYTSNNYFICLIDLTKKYSFETHLLIEINENGKILKKERFFHGNYPCCWKNYYEGFSKHDEYFCMKTCGTGSGYCASYFYLFKEILPQENQNSIPNEYWSSSIITEHLTSQMELKDNELTMHYKLETGELYDLDFKVNETKKFNIKYLFKNKKWTTNEESKFNGLDLSL